MRLIKNYAESPHLPSPLLGLMVVCCDRFVISDVLLQQPLLESSLGAFTFQVHSPFLWVVAILAPPVGNPVYREGNLLML